MPGGYLEEPAGFQGSGNPAGDPVQLPAVWGLMHWNGQGLVQTIRAQDTVCQLRIVEKNTKLE